MANLNERPERGLPVYLDPIDRRLPDPADGNESDWYPATPATRKLWHCYEAMQKLVASLDGMSAERSIAEHRRFLVQFSVPLCDFFLCVRDLINAIEGDKQTRSCLEDAELQHVRDLRTRYDQAVLNQIRPLKAIRDKLGAHTDKSLNPGEAEKLIGAVDANMVGAWLHAGLLALDKLTKLDCFAWTSAGYTEGQVRLMNCEPFVISLQGGELDFVGIEMTESPKRHVHERIANLVERSTWMFADGQSRLIVKRRDATNT